MAIPLWGREALIERVATADRTTSQIFRIVAAPGAWSDRMRRALAAELESSAAITSVAVAAARSAVAPGTIAQYLGDIDAADAVIVGHAHLADATSLGTIARRLSATRPVLVVLDHPPIDGINALAIDRLAATGAPTELVTLDRITVDDVATGLDIDLDTARVLLDTAGGNDEALCSLLEDLTKTDLEQPESLGRLLTDMASRRNSRIDRLDDGQRALLDTVIAADRPVPARLAAEALQRPVETVLADGESLAKEGLVTESAAGFGPAGEPRRSELRAGLGMTRRAHMLQGLATASEALGVAGAEPAATGLDYFAAEQWDRAFPHLQQAANRMTQAGTFAEAYPLISAALRCADNGANADDDEIAALLFGRARFYRDAGYPDLATADLDRSAALAIGASRIDTLGFKAATLDDRQLPQAAETTIATAEYEAVTRGAEEKLGSLLTFRARELSRLGFASEADRAMAVGDALIERHGTTTQRRNATRNRAWMAFDRGEMQRARRLFDDLTASDPLPDDLVWKARAEFGSGLPTDAQASLAQADAARTPGADHIVRFLTAIARAEGGLAYGRPTAALEAAHDELSLVALLLPSWENGTHYRRAAALAQLGEWDRAAEAIELAAERTPHGADGLRWGSRIAALNMVIEHARTGRWDATAAENLSDELMTANWFGAAGDLQTSRATIETDVQLGLDAAALAMHLGDPMAAARAIDAAEAWHHDDAAEVAAAIRKLRPQIPDDWTDDWHALPHVAAALTVEPAETEPRLAARLDRALESAGLANPDSVYSPAQRAARGLGRRRSPAPRRSPLLRVGIAAAAIGVAGVAGFLGSQVGDDPAPPPEPTVISAAAPPVSAPTTTLPLPIEQTILGSPESLVGQAPFLGGPALNAVVEATGVAELGGIYWEKTTGGPTRSAPVVVGNTIIVGGGDGFLHFVDTVDGTPNRYRMASRIDAPVASGELLLGSGPESSGRERAIVAADNSGSVVALRPDRSEIWEANVGAPVAAAPIITDQAVVVATTEGTIHGLSSGEGTELWRYPGEDHEALGPIETSLAVSDGALFASGRSGAVAIDIATGTQLCAESLGQPMSAPSTVSGGFVYTPTGSTIHVMTTGCGLRVDGGQAAIQMNVEVVTSPALLDDTLYVGSNLLLAGFSVIDGSEVMGTNLGSQITGSPVIAGDIIYVGTADGLVHAIDRETGQSLWQFDTGEAIDAPVAVIDDAVFVLTSAGRLIAIGPPSS